MCICKCHKFPNTEKFAVEQVLCHGSYKMWLFTSKVRLASYVCGLLSVFFLAATLYIYLTIQSLNNLHGSIVVGNIVSILLATLFLLVLYNVEPQVEESGKKRDSNQHFFCVRPKENSIRR